LSKIYQRIWIWEMGFIWKTRNWERKTTLREN